MRGIICYIRCSLSAPTSLRPDAPAYEAFYGFQQSPFTLAPDPRFLYLSESHDEAITLILQSIRRKEGFIILTGDIGTGKTTLCRALLQQLDTTTFTSLVLDPFVSVEELLREILLDFGIVSRDAVRSGRLESATKHELISTMHDFLLSLVPIHGGGVLIIDEAQHLSTSVLEQIRVLSNLETNDAKLLQIVLVGQLNLLDVLAAADMRQLDQRISLRATLKPLTRAEIEAYVTHRLAIAQGTTAVSFETAALDRVAALTAGVPRVINLLCDRALMIAADGGIHAITPSIINRAAAVLQLKALTPAIPAPQPASSRMSVWLGGAIALAVLVVLVLALPIDRLVEITLPPLPATPRLRTAVPIAPTIVSPDELRPVPARPRPVVALPGAGVTP